MRKLTKIEVVYEALGKQFSAYTDSLDLDYIMSVLHLISPTVHLVSMSHQIVCGQEAEEMDLEHIVKWHEEIEKRFNHIDKEAVI